MMRAFLLTLVVTYVFASSSSSKLSSTLMGLEVLAEDEKKGQNLMEEEVADHEGDAERENIFHYIGLGVSEMFEGLNKVTDKEMGLSNTTETGFIEEIHNELVKLRKDVCEQGEECSESPYMGCKCHGHFKKLEKETCRGFPCKAVQHMIFKSSQLLKDIRVQKNLTGLVNVAMKFAEPLLKEACQCNPSLIDTGISCIVDYDGGLIEEEMRDGYKEIMGMVKFDYLKTFAETMFGAYCGDDKGACLGNFQKISAEFAAMMDRSFDDEQKNKCNNYRRLSDGIWEMIEYFVEEKDTEPSVKQILQKVYSKVFKNFWCGSKKCAVGHLSDQFNNDCCFRNAVEKFDEDTVKDLWKFAQSVIKVIGGKLPRCEKAIQKILTRSVNPNLACKRRYEDADQCDAIEAFLQ